MKIEALRPVQVYSFPLEKLKAPESLPSFFSKTYASVIHGLKNQSDLRVSRALAISMLAEAWNREEFLEDNPGADELDRIYMIIWLQYISSCLGLLQREEIKQMQESDGRVLPPVQTETKSLLSFNELAALTKSWAEAGQVIGLFHGSFDPPTIIHLFDAAQASEHCHRLIIGFDSDELLRARKGQDRPRFLLDWRRQIFSSFWMVDATVVMRPAAIDGEQYLRDYRDLHIGRLFTIASDPNLQDKRERMEQVGGQVITTSEYYGQFHSSQLMELLRKGEAYDIRF